MKQKFTVYLCLLIAIFSSCKKESLIDNQVNASAEAVKKTLDLTDGTNITFENGRMKFASQAAFQQLMTQAVADTLTPVIKHTITSLPNYNFYSYADKAYANNLDATNAIKEGKYTTLGTRPTRGEVWLEQDSLIEDQLFSQVVNSTGELEVENTVYKITPNGTFAVQASSLAALNGMLDANGMLQAQYANSLTPVDSENGFYKVNGNTYLYDTYGKVRGITSVNSTVPTEGSNPRPGGRPDRGNGFPTSPNTVINTVPYKNMDITPFNSKYTIAGKFLQSIFGDAKYKYFAGTPDRRLKVNFYSRNWLVYASTGVRAVIQKKTSLGLFSVWGPVENKDEMRLGWTPLVLKLDIPAVTMPNTTPPKDPLDVAGKMLKSHIKIKLGDQEYTGIQVSDVIDVDNAFPFLPSNWRTQINDLTFDVNAFIKEQADNQVDAFFKTIKSKIGYTSPSNKIAFVKNDRLMIDKDEQTHTASQGNGVMSRTFDFNTAIVGFSTKGDNTTYIFKPAKTIEVISGSCYAIGKLNGEWLGIAVVKQP